MKLLTTTCYSRILYLLTAGRLFSEAVNSLKITSSPDFKAEGFNGFIETTVEIEIKDLKKFTDIWESYFSLTDAQRTNLYGLAKGLGDRK